MTKKLRVLIVEDEALIALLLADILASLGFELYDIVATEAKAVAAALSLLPDLMIVDAGLANGSGVDAMRTILQTRAIPHLFVTGNKRQVESLATDAVVLEKPFFIPELVQAIETVLAVAAAKV